MRRLSVRDQRLNYTRFGKKQVKVTAFSKLNEAFGVSLGMIRYLLKVGVEPRRAEKKQLTVAGSRPLRTRNA